MQIYLPQKIKRGVYGLKSNNPSHAVMTLPTGLLKPVNQKLVWSADERDLRQEDCIPSRTEKSLPVETQQLLKRGLEVLHRLAEVRDDRVEAIRIQIASGIYRIDNEAIAQKMLGIKSV